MAYSSSYSNASFMVDGVMLTEWGVNAIKAQTVEKEKKRRSRGQGRAGPMSTPGQPGMLNDSNDTSMDQDGDGGDDPDLDDNPGAGSGSLKDAGNHKDGDPVKPLPDGRAPDGRTPDGRTRF